MPNSYFVTISRDPNGVYVGVDRRGKLWQYVPDIGKWFYIEWQED